MSEMKTRVTKQSAATFVKDIQQDQKRRDCQAIMKIMHRVTGKRATMWGTSIVGYGKYHYQYASGREGEMCLTGFSPRAQNIAVYIMPGFELFKAELKKLGKHKIGKSCLYLKSLQDIDLGILEELISASVVEMRKRYPTG